MAQARQEAVRYEFPPASDGAVALGLSVGQLTIVVSALLGVIGASRSGLPLWLVAPVVAPVLGFGTLRWRGERFTTLLIRWVSWWLRPRRSKRRSPLVAQATLPNPGGNGGGVAPAEVPAPGWAGGLELLAVPYRDDAAVGVWRDGDAYVVVLSLSAPAIALRDLAEQEAFAAIWGDLLASAGVEGSPVQRIGWVARTAPDDGADAAAWFRDHARTVGLSDTDGQARELSPVWRSYLTVGDAVGTTAAARDLMVVVRVQPDRARHRLRGVRDRTERQARAAAMAVAETERIGHRLVELGCTVELYRPEALAAMVRTTFDPLARAELAYWRAGSGDADAGVSPLSGMWPLSFEEPTDHVRTDGGYHRVYWIEEWPTVPVLTTWLQPMLLPSSTNRTVSVLMEPVALHNAVRAAHRARASAATEADVRTRHGFLTSARAERSLESAERREQELIDGHRDMYFAGYVCVTGRSVEELEDACATTVHDAGRARLRLRALHGEHWPALSAVLPIGRFI